MKNVFRAQLLVPLLAVLLSPWCSASAAGYGLMVGIDQYAPGYAGSLPSCVNDANGFGGMLTGDATRWPVANVTTLTDAAASKTAIRNKLAALAAAAVSGDRVVYFHSSHGGQHSGTDTFLCSYNANYEDDELASDLMAFRTGVSVIIVIDACHSAGMFKDALGVSGEWEFARNVMAKMQAARAQSAPQAKGAEIGWITAANYDEYSWAGDPYSLMVAYLIDGFQYGDANADGLVTFLELINYASPLATADNPTQHAQTYNTALLGATVARPAVVNEVVPLEEALDNAVLSWTTGGSRAWYGQTLMSSDGVDAARSGAISHSQESWLQTTLTGPGILKFKWKVSSERRYDFLRFYYDGVVQGSGLTGETNWVSQVWTIPAGTHTVRWVYSKDDSAIGGSDCGWVDQVEWLQPCTVTFDAEGGTVTPTSINVYSGAAYGPLPVPARGADLFAGWWTGEGGTGGQVGSTTTVAVAENHTLYAKWVAAISLSAALDTDGLTWTTGGKTNWFGQALTTADGEDAAQSGALAHSQQSWMQTTVTGPVTVSYRWKVSSQSGRDFLRFYVGAAEQAGKISGETAWEQRTHLLPAGSHTLKWAYAKDGSGSGGADCGWVDQVTLSQGLAAFGETAHTTTGEGNSGVGGVSAVVPVSGVGPVSVKVSALPASATTADYVFPAAGTNLTWGSGESGVKFVTVPIRGDALAEGDEVFYLALGSPAGGVAGDARVCTVVISDDDTGLAPNKGVFVAGVPQPPEGGRVTGGGYCLPGKVATLTASPSAGWTFLAWEDGSQVAARKVTGEQAAQAAQNNVMRGTAFFKRTSEIAAPQTANPGPQEATVGVAFSLGLTVSAECLPRVTVTGLPAGLRYDAASRSITGVPSKAGTFSVTFTAASVAGAAMSSQTFSVAVSPLPVWVAGSFAGTCVMPGCGALGTAQLTVSALGKISGKLSAAGTNYTFSAGSFTNGGGFAFTAVAAAGQARLPLSVRLTPPSPDAPAGLGMAEGWLGGAEEAPADAELWRNVWKDPGMAGVATNYTGYYTASLPGGTEYGSGYLTFTVDKAGGVKTAGKLADGTAVSLAGTLVMDSVGRVVAVLHTTPAAYKGGCLFGLAQFYKASGSSPVFVRSLPLTALLWESRNPQATADFAAGGFSRHAELIGGWYDTVGNLYRYYADAAFSAATDGWAPPPELSVGTNRFASAWWRPEGVALAVVTNRSGVMTGLAAPKAGVPADPDRDGVWDYGATNTVGLTLALTRATGVFKGSFKAWFDTGTTHTSKSVAYEGVLVPETGDEPDGVAGRGFFLWADKATYLNPQNRPTPYAFNWSYDFLLLTAPAR